MAEPVGTLAAMSQPIENLRADGDRLWSALMAMAEIGKTELGGCNRQALSDEDRRARDQFAQWAREIGCQIRVDEMGNVFAVRPGTEAEAPPVLIGSHLDTQPTGGRFDGVYGVLAGLEVLRVLADRQVDCRRTIEVVSWTNEEGSRFVPAMLGSGVVAAAHTLEFAYDRTDRDGHKFLDELDRIGYRGSAPAQTRRLHAAFEAHIEQGPILERTGTTIGVVTGIQGLEWLDVILDGVECHAGPTPMEDRRDPWRAACPIIEGAFELAHRYSPWGRATIGDVRVKPGSRNTVPGQLSISVDLRHPQAVTLKQIVAEFHDLVETSARRCNIDFVVHPVWSMPATVFDTRLVDLVESSASSLGYASRRIVSGAGHDSLHVAKFAPTAMIFVPCAGGLSHNELERAAPEDLEAGANVLLRAVLAAANE